LLPSEAVECAEISTQLDGNLNLVYFGPTEGNSWDILQNIGRDPASAGFELFHTGVECASEYGVSGEGFAVVRGFDEPLVPYTGARNNLLMPYTGAEAPDMETLIKFMRVNAVPSVHKFSDELVNPLFKDGKPAVILFTAPDTQVETKLETIFEEVARKYRGNVLDLYFVKSGLGSKVEKNLG